MASRGGITWDDKSLAGRLHDFPVRADKALTAIILYHSPRLEGVMRQGAPWTDQTGNARSGLFVRPKREKGVRYALILAHSVNYGIWLEIAKSGRYAIVVPTLRAEGPHVMASAGQLFTRMFT